MHAVQCSAVQCSAVQRSAVRYSAVQWGAGASRSLSASLLVVPQRRARPAGAVPVLTARTNVPYGIYGIAAIVVLFHKLN